MQGGCLFLALFYAPRILHSDASLMRTLMVSLWHGHPAWLPRSWPSQPVSQGHGGRLALPNVCARGQPDLHSQQRVARHGSRAACRAGTARACRASCLRQQWLVQDRHLADSWVVPWGFGLQSDLVVAWDGFKAARSAMASTASAAAARDQAAGYQRDVADLHQQLTGFLETGRLQVRPVRGG